MEYWCFSTPPPTTPPLHHSITPSLRVAVPDHSDPMLQQFYACASELGKGAVLAAERNGNEQSIHQRELRDSGGQRSLEVFDFAGRGVKGQVRLSCDGRLHAVRQAKSGGLFLAGDLQAPNGFVRAARTGNTKGDIPFAKLR